MKPKTVDKVSQVFACDVSHLMPTDEPDYVQYRKEEAYRKTWGFQLFKDWFYYGLESLKMTPKEGIDSEQAMGHITAIMRSWEPKHEDKTAACAFLFEHWFSDAKWERKEKP